MSPSVRLVIGAMTVILYGAAGLTLVADPGSWRIVGIVFLGLAAYRLLMWLRDLRWFLQPDED